MSPSKLLHLRVRTRRKVIFRARPHAWTDDPCHQRLRRQLLTKLLVFFDPWASKDSWVPGAVGSFSWAGYWGTFFWISPVENLLGLQMIQGRRAAKRCRTLGSIIWPMAH